MSTPVVSVIIPVGPAHRSHAATAVASCLWQSFRDYDTGQALPVAEAGRIRIVDVPPSPGKRRSSVARNAGLAVARGVFTTWLDADDYLLPNALERLLRGHATHSAAYSYGWHYGLNRAGGWGLFRSPEYDREKLTTFNLHPITALVPTWCARECGGFDEEALGLEDWTFWLRMAVAGFCGQQIYGPTFVYRRDEGVNHGPDVDGGLELMDAVRARYQDKTGEIPMAGCGCSGGAASAKAVAQQVARTLGEIPMTDDGLITLEYTGPGEGAQWFTHPQSRRQIRAGGKPTTKYVQVPAEDAPYYLGLELFQRVPPPSAFVPPPDPRTVAAGTVAESVAMERGHDASTVMPKRTLTDLQPRAEPQFEEPEAGKASPYPGRKARRAE
jgi:hypothetical protein